MARRSRPSRIAKPAARTASQDRSCFPHPSGLRPPSPLRGEGEIPSPLQPHRLQPLRLTLGDDVGVEAGDRVLVHAVEIEPRAEPEEGAAEADGGALEEDELARDQKAAAFGAQRAHRLADLLAPVFGRAHPVGGGAHAVVEDRPADEARPDGHRLERAARQLREPPERVGLGDMRVVVGPQAPIELDHAAHEARRKDAHAAVVEQIDPLDPQRLALARGDDRVIAEMRVAVDDPVAQERPPPGVEQADRDRVARFLRRAFELGQLFALEPLQRQETAGAQLLVDARHAHERPVGEHHGVEARDLRLAHIVELLAHPLADLAGDLARLDRPADPLVQREQEIELRQVGFDRRRHLRILQFAGDLFAVERPPLVHLAERGRRGGLQVELGEALAPVRPEFGDHPPADEACAHRRRLRLQADQLVGVVGRQRVGDGGQELRDLHHRPLHRAERRGEGARVGIAPAAGQPVHADAGGERAGVDAETGVARGAGGEAVGFVVLGQNGSSGFLVADTGRRRPFWGGPPVRADCGGSREEARSGAGL